MTTNRISPKRGFCNLGALPKGSNGRALCRECGTEVPKDRKSFCSQKCVDTWKIKTDPTFVRIKLYERDHGVCQKCKTDCVALVHELEKLDHDHRRVYARSLLDKEVYKTLVTHNQRLVERLQEFKISIHRYTTRRWYGIWDADHIKAVIEGGGECGLENYRTLCLKCHHEETLLLRKRRGPTNPH